MGSELSNFQLKELDKAIDKVIEEYGEVLYKLGGGKKMERPFFIYLVHPMSGLSWEEVEEYYSRMKTKLEALGYFVLHPMCAKKMLSGKKFDSKASEKRSPVVTPHAITRRDHWMVRKADIILADFTPPKGKPISKSTGSISEVATAYELGKHTLGIMKKGNIHEHAFMYEQLDIIFEEEEEATEYLKKLIRGEY